MNSDSPKISTIDDYIARYPAAIQTLLTQMRVTIRAAAPDAIEKIGYAMPTFYLKGNLVYFAALKQHIGFYPTASGMLAFQHELSGYPATKGAVRFPFDQPLPLEVISAIVRFRVEENLRKFAEKARK